MSEKKEQFTETPKDIEKNSLLERSDYKQIPVHFVKNKLGVEHSLVAGLKYILPEDLLWRKENPRIPAMVCLEQNHVCHCPWNCMPKFAERAFWLFEKYPDLLQILVVFSREDKELIRKEPKIRLSTVEQQITGLKPVVGETKVPRLFVVLISRDMNIQTTRAKKDFFKRLNYDGLQLSLKKSNKRYIEVPSIW